MAPLIERHTQTRYKPHVRIDRIERVAGIGFGSLSSLRYRECHRVF
jgi:hypothetical protein